MTAVRILLAGTSTPAQGRLAARLADAAAALSVAISLVDVERLRMAIDDPTAVIEHGLPYRGRVDEPLLIAGAAPRLWPLVRAVAAYHRRVLNDPHAIEANGWERLRACAAAGLPVLPVVIADGTAAERIAPDLGGWPLLYRPLRHGEIGAPSGGTHGSFTALLPNGSTPFGVVETALYAAGGEGVRPRRLLVADGALVGAALLRPGYPATMAPTEVSARETEIAMAAAAACQLAVAAVDIVGEATAPRITEVDPLPGIMAWEDEMDLPAAAAWIGAAIAAR